MLIFKLNIIFILGGGGACTVPTPQRNRGSLPGEPHHGPKINEPVRSSEPNGPQTPRQATDATLRG